MKQKKCIVIGAGVAGLSAAALLAKKGYNVTVFEQSKTYGGKVGELTVGNAHFDSGPSLCTDVHVIDSIYKKCQKNPRDYWNYEKLPEITRYFWPSDGSAYTMPDGIARIERSLVHSFNESPKKVRKYMDVELALYKAIAPYYIDRPLRASSLLYPKVFVASLRLLPFVFTTLQRRNAKFFTNKKTVQLLNRYATYSGSNPYLAPAVMGFAGIPELSQGAYFPTNGMRGIADGLHKLCLDMGVHFTYKAKVSAILHKDDTAYAVKVGSIIHQCDEVIYGGDIVRLYELLGDTHMKQKVSKSERSTSAIVFYWQVRGSYKKFGLHNVIFSADYKEEYDQLKRGEVPTDPTIYINITCKKDPSHAKKNTENWFVMINVPAGTQDVAVLSAKETVKAKLEALLGGYITIEEETYLSPTKLDAQTSAWKGAIYGQATNSIGALLFRPRNYGKTPKNIYRVGGTVHPGGGIPLAVRSAIITADNL